MALVQINELLKDTVIDKLKHAKSGLFALTVKIYSSENPDPNHVVTPLYITSYSIIQDFTKIYTDIVAISMELEPTDFIKVYSNYQNLYCTLYSYPVLEETHLPDYGLNETFTNNEEFLSNLNNAIYKNTVQEGWTHSYKAVICGIEDILKQINPNELLKTDLNNYTDELQAKKVPIALQLITEDAYNISKGAFSGTLKNSTVQTAIYTVANSLGINNVSMVPPDNQTIHRQIIIPPIQKLESFLSTLQNDPGIYTKGCGYYYTGGTLYIYPAFEPSPDTNNGIINIYKVPENMFPGLFGYCSIDKNGDIHIVTDTLPQVTDDATKSLETVGNQTITFNTDQMFDASRQIKGTTGSFSNENMLTINMEGVEGNTKDSYTINYVKGTNNPYAITSDMSENNKTTVIIGWHNPIPYLITPGKKCCYHYEDEQGYKTKTGIIDGVSYIFQINSRSSDYIYKGEAIIVLRLASDSESLISANEELPETTNNNNSESSIFDIIGNLSMNSFKNLFQ